MRLFVAGTDTGIGKTMAACELLRALGRRGVPTIGMKPVCAGIDARGRWEDVDAIRAASPLQADLDDMAPYRLRAVASPHFAAAEDGVTIEAEPVLAALARLERAAEVVVIEGVGGFRVPLSEKLDSADLAQAIGAPVLLVVGLRLGCINHALLTGEAIAARGLALAGWLANRGIDADYPRTEETIDTISARIGASCIGVMPRLSDQSSSGDWLRVSELLSRLRPQQIQRRKP